MNARQVANGELRMLVVVFSSGEEPVAGQVAYDTALVVHSG